MIVLILSCGPCRPAREGVRAEGERERGGGGQLRLHPIALPYNSFANIDLLSASVSLFEWFKSFF